MRVLSNKNDRIRRLQNMWLLFNYNPWHDELGRFTYAGHGTFVAPSNLISFSPSKVLTKRGDKDMAFNYSKMPNYRPDKAAATASMAYQNGMSAEINRAVADIRNARSSKEMFERFNDIVKMPSGVARVPGDSGNYVFTSTAIRNTSRTMAFTPDEDMTIYRGIAGDHYSKRALKGTMYQSNDFFSSSVSATVGTDFGIRRATQNGKDVTTVYSVKVPKGTAMGIPTYTKQKSGIPGAQNYGVSDEGEVILPPSTVFRINKVGNLKTVKGSDGQPHKVREIQLEVVPQEKASDELARGDYSRYEDK